MLTELNQLQEYRMFIMIVLWKIQEHLINLSNQDKFKASRMVDILHNNSMDSHNLSKPLIQEIHLIMQLLMLIILIKVSLKEIMITLKIYYLKYRDSKRVEIRRCLQWTIHNVTLECLCKLLL